LILFSLVAYLCSVQSKEFHEFERHSFFAFQ
jgi:hypothetical protein